MAVVLATATRQRVRVALFICPRPLECRSRFFPAPLWQPPFAKFTISVAIEAGCNACAWCYTFGRVDAVSSASPGIHRWLSEFRQAQ